MLTDYCCAGTDRPPSAVPVNLVGPDNLGEVYALASLGSDGFVNVTIPPYRCA